MAKLNLNLSAVAAERDGFDLLPEGIYNLRITAVEVKATKGNDGHYLEVACQVIDGSQAGKVICDRITIKNKSEDATRIGLARLKKIAEVGGHKNPNLIGDTDELVGLTFSASTVNESFSSDGKDYQSTKVRKVRGEVQANLPPVMEQAPQAEAPAPAPAKATPAPAAAPAAKLPWE